jgi:two-component system, chemotaxis family, protein-glutamate methylesterase/glutaminase
MTSSQPIRVLVVDDSIVVRKLLSDALGREPDMEVVGTASDPFVARDLILQHRPDVLTLDVEMPRMDGLTFLRRLMEHHPMPVIVVSSVTQTGSAASIEALQAGAVDVIPKPGGPYSIGQVSERLKQQIRAVKSAPRIQFLRSASRGVRPAPVKMPKCPNGIILMGASTGGTQAIETLLSRLPTDHPPIAVVQHMPANFTRAFADRLDRVCSMRVTEARDDELLQPGTVYIAPGDRHLLIRRFGVQLRTALTDNPPLNHQRPAVDVLFESVAKIKGVPTVALLLTGMGCDGAEGMVKLRRAGAETIAQDEQSCVVFGMPREAILRGGAQHVATLLHMPALVARCLERFDSGRAA